MLRIVMYGLRFAGLGGNINVETFLAVSRFDVDVLSACWFKRWREFEESGTVDVGALGLFFYVFMY